MGRYIDFNKFIERVRNSKLLVGNNAEWAIEIAKASVEYHNEDKIVELPCKTGDIAYYIYFNYFNREYALTELKVQSFKICEKGIYLTFNGIEIEVGIERIGKEIFFDYDEALREYDKKRAQYADIKRDIHSYIVKCKDCKYFSSHPDHCHRLASDDVDEDFWCKYGEK